MTDIGKYRRLFAVALCMSLAAGAARAEPALWKVTGSKSTVYLFGSVHLLPEGGFAVGVGRVRVDGCEVGEPRRADGGAKIVVGRGHVSELMILGLGIDDWEFVRGPRCTG